MKTILTAGFALLILTIAACKKDEKSTTTTPGTHVGIWTGKYGTGINTPSNSYGMVIFSGTSMLAFDGLPGSSSEAGGTYYIHHTDSIKGVYTYKSAGGSTFYFRGKLNSSRTHMDGTWGSDTAGTSGGTFYLDK